MKRLVMSILNLPVALSGEDAVSAAAAWTAVWLGRRYSNVFARITLRSYLVKQEELELEFCVVKQTK